MTKFRQRLKSGLIRCGELLWYSTKDFFIDDGLHWAAAIAFYGVLSIFPLMLAGVAIAAGFADPTWATEKATNLLGNFMPRGEQTIRNIIETAVAKGTRTSVLSVIVLLVAGTRVFSALIRALNVAYDVDEMYSALKRFALQLAMLFSAGLLFAAALLTDFAAILFKHALHSFPQGSDLVVRVLGWLLPAMLLLGGFFCLYRFVPRNRCNWKSALIGAVTASALLSGARVVFVEYLRHLDGYTEIYGWLAIGIVLLVWAYIAALITLFCGELLSHIQMMIFEGLSGKEISNRHRRRSPRKQQNPLGG